MCVLEYLWCGVYVCVHVICICVICVWSVYMCYVQAMCVVYGMYEQHACFVYSACGICVLGVVAQWYCSLTLMVHLMCR